MFYREWYSYHFPELVKIVGDNYLFARCAQFIKNRKELTDESVPLLEEIVKDAGIAQSILDAARSSMGKLVLIESHNSNFAKPFSVSSRHGHFSY